MKTICFLMENNVPWVDPDCAEITSGMGSQCMGDKGGNGLAGRSCWSDS